MPLLLTKASLQLLILLPPLLIVATVVLPFDAFLLVDVVEEEVEVHHFHHDKTVGRLQASPDGGIKCRRGRMNNSKSHLGFVLRLHSHAIPALWDPPMSLFESPDLLEESLQAVLVDREAFLRMHPIISVVVGMTAFLPMNHLGMKALVVVPMRPLVAGMKVLEVVLMN
jgi:hypothetical protein